jgi:hypothetical protein
MNPTPSGGNAAAKPSAWIHDSRHQPRESPYFLSRHPLNTSGGRSILMLPATGWRLSPEGVPDGTQRREDFQVSGVYRLQAVEQPEEFEEREVSGGIGTDPDCEQE